MPARPKKKPFRFTDSSRIPVKKEQYLNQCEFCDFKGPFVTASLLGQECPGRQNMGIKGHWSYRGHVRLTQKRKKEIAHTCTICGFVVPPRVKIEQYMFTGCPKREHMKAHKFPNTNWD